MNAKTYENIPGFAKTGQELHNFGEKQNSFNAQLLAQVEALTAQLAAAEEHIARLEAEQEKNIQRFGRCAAELDQMQKEIDRLKLTAKLNSNAIDRMAKENH
jgi:transposase